MPATPAPQLNEVCSAWESGRERPWRRGPCTHVGTCSWVLPPFGDGASVRECGGNKADLPTRGGVRLTLTGLCCNTRLGGGQAPEPTPRPGERCWAASLRRPAQLRAGSHQRSAMGAGGCGALAGATPCARPPGRDHGRRAVQERRAFGDPSPFVRGAAGRSCLPRCPAGPAAGAGRPRPPTCFRTAAPTPRPEPAVRGSARTPREAFQRAPRGRTRGQVGQLVRRPRGKPAEPSAPASQGTEHAQLRGRGQVRAGGMRSVKPRSATWESGHAR